MVQVNASLLSSKLFWLFTNRELQGKIHSRFQNALNIELDDGFVFNFLPEKIPPNPRSLVLPLTEWNSIQDLFIPIGLPVQIKGDQLEIPTLLVKIYFGESKLWDPSPSLPRSPISASEIYQNLGIIAAHIQQHDKNGNAGKFSTTHSQTMFENTQYEDMPKAPYKAFQNRIWKATNDLFISISNCNFEDVSKSSYQLIGLGPGLTPAGDDVLSGVMAAGVFCSLAFKALYFDMQKINTQIISGASGRTTTFSQILLSDASMGEVVRPLGQLLQEILCGNDKALLVSLTRQVMALGESSGRDMLSGIIMGMKALLRLRDKITLTKQ